MRFTNKVCLVTGAGSGIGRATAIQFASEEGQVVVIDRDDKSGNETVDLITKASGKAIFSHCDVGIKEISKRLLIYCVAPRAVDTPMLWNNPNVKSGAETISGAIGKPEELARAICFMASDDASFINGTTLVVDGGRLDIL